MVTSSFNKNVDRLPYLFGASEHIARIRRKLPFGYHFHVHPSLNGETLASFVSGHLFREKELTAWVYIGHGFEGNLQTSDTVWKPLPNGRFRAEAVREKPQFWLDQFRGYEKGLPLVLFCACESEKIARQFAQAGVSVAIGFKKKVLLEQCWAISEEVIPAAIKTHGDRMAIVNAFHRACLRLPKPKIIENGQETHHDPEPVAFLHRS